jgi:CheY-like chemotaxis protein
MAHILVIDDDTSFRGFIRTLLEMAGHVVFEASNGKDAIEMLEHAALPDLVITDLLMPQMDGIEILQYLRRLKEDIRILAMSGGGRLGPGGLLNAATRLGAHSAITKPFRREEFIQTVNELLAA